MDLSPGTRQTPERLFALRDDRGLAEVSLVMKCSSLGQKVS
jgi:hypothetical protein